MAAKRVFLVRLPHPRFFLEPVQKVNDIVLCYMAGSQLIHFYLFYRFEKPDQKKKRELVRVYGVPAYSSFQLQVPGKKGSQVFMEIIRLHCSIQFQDKVCRSRQYQSS